MIIDLNLLPPDRRAKLNQLIQILFLKNMLEFVIVALCLFAVILVLSWTLLVREFNNLTQSALLIGRDYSGYNQEVRRINNIIRRVNDANADYLPILPKILEITQTLPNNIKLNTINIDRRTQRFLISGTARTRNDLLMYQEILKKIKWLKPATMPTTQLLQKENINFEYQTDLVGLPSIRNTAVASRPRPVTRPIDE